MTDMTGTPVTLKDVEEAERVVKTTMVVAITHLPPLIAVNLPNILRCLQELRALKEAQLLAL